MINRILLRIKIVQIVFAYYKSGEKDYGVAEKELFHSIEKTYDLYYHLLLLAIEVTRHARNKIDAGLQKYRPTEEDLNPNRRFADNRFIAQLEANEMFVERVEQKNLSWIDSPEVIKSLYDSIVSSECYKSYMEGESSDYAADKELWRKIFRNEVLNNKALAVALEEQSIYWCAEADFVISFILKTIKKFDESKGTSQALLPMYNHDEDKRFAQKLFFNTIRHGDEYKALIEEFTKNWELDRIAYMDVIIMMVALGELNDFPSIPVNVTLNEYIEIAKQYSTDKSGTFVNGVLDKIVSHLKREGTLVKAN
jgi:transcription antitermination factor NusB